MLGLTTTITLFLFLAGAIANPVRPTRTLLDCLNDSGLNIETSQNPDWSIATAAFNTRFHFNPAAIVYPTQTIEVSKAVQCAAQHGVRVSALSGGHSYTASGYGSQDGALVIVFRDMTQASYNAADGTVVVQPGARLGDLALYLNDHGRGMAHGHCPWVGVGGHAGFGGWGFASRNWGLVVDQVRSAMVVLSDGRVIEANKQANPDIFWAILGASSSFGIVTQYVFQTHEAPESVVRFAYNFNNRSSDEFARLLQAYQRCGLTARKELGMVANVWQGGKDIEMAGMYMGNRSDFYRLSSALLSATGPADTTYVQERDWITGITEASGEPTLSTKGGPEPHDTFMAKSLTVQEKSPITTEAFANLAKYFTSAKPPDVVSEWFIQFELTGGNNSAISSVAADATAYPHRSHHLTCQFYGRSKGSWSPQATEFVNGLSDAITDSMPGTSFGAYANYLDGGLRGWREKYYGGNYGRLAALQKKIDPTGVFMKAQNIGAPDS